MKTYFPLLDPIRFGSALGVALFHQMFWSWAGDTRGFDRYLSANVQFPSAVRFTWFGWVGVEIFFVISGFVIANSASKSSPIEFLMGRALRLYPAVWVCSTATLVVLLFATGSSSEFVLPYIRSMLLIPRGPWIDGVLWSLAAEVAFYALMLFTLLTPRVTLPRAAWALTVYSGVFNAFAFLTMLGVIHSQRLYLFVVMHRISWAPSLLYHGCFFALGIWLYIAANRKLTTLELLAMSLAFLSGTAEIFNFSSYFLTSISAASGQSPFVPIVVWAACVSIIGIAADRNRRSTAAPTTGYLKTLGLISYPLYLAHNVVGKAIARVLIDAGLNAVLAPLVALSIVVALCWVFCSKGEPVIRTGLKNVFVFLGLLPKNKGSLGSSPRFAS